MGMLLLMMITSQWWGSMVLAEADERLFLISRRPRKAGWATAFSRLHVRAWPADHRRARFMTTSGPVKQLGPLEVR